MKKLAVGILAHVDAGKTTLSEGMLYASGSIRKMGRVDKKDAFLDHYELERARGITIFSKQAQIVWKQAQITLLDTPGHVDFSAEMERTLQVMDYAVLVISGADGIQAHTRTLWRLLEKYNIPVFCFINKMDQEKREKSDLLKELCQKLGSGFVDFTDGLSEQLYEQIAMCEEKALEYFLEKGQIEREMIGELTKKRVVFPSIFGSALRMDGVEHLMDIIECYARSPIYHREFGARVFKVGRDDLGNRLTFMKITGGKLQARDTIPQEDGSQEQKINQIRIYSGNKYEAVQVADEGTVCAVTGLGATYPGQGLGCEDRGMSPVLAPVLTYRICLPGGCDPGLMLQKLRLLQEEDPMLHLLWKEDAQEIHAQVMGEIQLEVLKNLIQERFDTEVAFETGAIIYKETIGNLVEGVGHFEPLRHYAEVHLLMEPGEPGSGLVFETSCSEDILDRNWQRLVLTHLAEREHVGVLTGSVITDMKITLASGKAHPKHTEGGDFRQATYRAVRQGLMEAESILLEPVYDFLLELPENMIGRAMMDLEVMGGTFASPEFVGEMVVLKGSVPVASVGDYQREVIAYTRGQGHFFCTLKGYVPCHNRDEVVSRIGYDPLRDMENPTGSVFCEHGAGYTVSWDRVKSHMHLESCIPREAKKTETAGKADAGGVERWLGIEEIDQILSKASFANQGKDKRAWKKPAVLQSYAPASPKAHVPQKKKDNYLLVDGYNVIFAWEELKMLAQATIDGARERLLEILCNYQAMKGMELIVVFDAYRVQGHVEEFLDYHNIHVVFTREAETADQYIEKFAHVNGKNFDITVATSDGLEQIIIMGQGCRVLSARDLKEEVELLNKQMAEEYFEEVKKVGSSLKEKMAEIDLDEENEVMKS